MSEREDLRRTILSSPDPDEVRAARARLKELDRQRLRDGIVEGVVAKKPVADFGQDAKQIPAEVKVESA